MNPATLSAPRPAIHETKVRLGSQRGAPRYFVNTRYLARAGFAHEMWIRLVPGEKTLVIEPSAQPTGKRVQEKGGMPLIDLNCKLLETVFGSAKNLHVRIERGRILLSAHPFTERTHLRPRDGSVGGLYAGIGLLDEAARQAGYTPKWAVEIDERAVDYYGENHPEALTYAMSVYDTIDLDLEPVELLCIGQPCQPWSNLRTTTDNKGTKRDRALPATAHPLGHLVAATIILIAKLNPRTIVLENVPGFASSETAYLLKGFLEEMNYVVNLDVLDSADYGALTSRSRTVLVAQTPEDCGRVREPYPEKQECPLQVADVLDAQVPEELWWDRVSKPNRFRRVEEAKQKGRGFVFQRVQPEDRKLGTFTAEYGNSKIDVPLVCHPEREDTFRYFTLAEGKRIMGVPESYVFPEGQTYPWVLLGQGVQVDLFRQVFSRLRSPLPPLASAGSESQPEKADSDAPLTLFGDLPLFSQGN